MGRLLNILKGIYSVILLLVSVVLVQGLIFNQQTKLSSEVHPVFAFFALWGSVGCLTMIEGGQGSLVGLAPVNRELYKESHRIAYKCSIVAHNGDRLDRYLLGRQFMVVLVVFIVNMAGAPLKDADFWGLPSWIKTSFLTSGIAMILFTCMVGQLNSQVNASHHMLDYLNNWVGLFTLYVANLIEFSGLLHASYLLQLIVGNLAGTPIESYEDPRTWLESFFFWFRCLVSFAILGLCTSVTMIALFNDQTTVWEGIPPGVSVVIFLFLMCVVGMLEGMQIAFFAAAKVATYERGEGIFARKTCALLYFGENNNLPGFMVGRQLCVVSCMFFIARVTSVDLEEDEENIFGVPDSIQQVFNTGLLGAFVLTILGSISWQLVASAFPLAFIQNPLTYFLLRICLALEATGICQAAWVLASIHKKIAGFERDEVYIGTAEERAKQEMADDAAQLPLGAGHMIKLPGFSEAALKELLQKDPSIAQYIKKVLEDMKFENDEDDEDDDDDTQGCTEI